MLRITVSTGEQYLFCQHASQLYLNATCRRYSHIFSLLGHNINMINYDVGILTKTFPVVEENSHRQLLAFVTGLDIVPPLSFEPTLVLEFNHQGVQTMYTWTAYHTPTRVPTP